MDDRITILRGSGDDSEVYTCGMCGNAILGSDPSFTVAGEGDDYCSMACARKALGIEACALPENALCGACRNTRTCREYGCTYHPGPACANYEPEAEPFDFPACPCVAVEAEPEAEVWYWKCGNRGGRDVLTCDLRSQHILVHNPAPHHAQPWPMLPADMALIAAAPQTAANLKAAEAENATLRDALKQARDRTKAALGWLDREGRWTAGALRHIKLSQRELDAALGQDGA